jgi:hypothetical protein
VIVLDAGALIALERRERRMLHTSDVDDLEDLRAFFPGVRVLGV